MGNTLQPNPSNAADDFVQPDWNSKSGEGVAPASDDSVDLQDNYAAQREGAKTRLESKNDPS